MLRSIYSISKSLGFKYIYKILKGLLPSKFKYWVGQLSEKYNPTPLVIVEELGPRYKKACQLLTERIGASNIGDYLEFGVCHGTSMSCMFDILKELQLEHVRLFGFDSFEGLPPETAIDTTNNWQPGEFASSLEFTTKRLTNRGVDWNRTFLVKGWYSNTLTAEFIKTNNMTKASIIMIDCDLYLSSIESLNFCGPLIKDCCVVIFDDWIEANVGEKKAYDEFLSNNPHLKSEQFATYKPAGRLFLVTNTQA